MFHQVENFDLYFDLTWNYVENHIEKFGIGKIVFHESSPVIKKNLVHDQGF